MKKKFIQKMLAAVFATTTIVSMATSFVSANPHYENIIDKNSQKPEDIERNAIRKLVNDKFTKGILHIFPKSVFFEKNILKAHSTRKFRTFACSNVNNRFDLQIYYDIGDQQHCTHVERHGHLMPLTKHHAPQFKTKFNFLSTKIALINELIENQNDLIKQFLLKYASGDILKIEDQTDMSTKCSDPYYSKEIAEKIYLHYMKETYDSFVQRNNNNNNNVDPTNFQTKKEEHEAAIKGVEDALAQLQIEQKAYAAALCDAENQTESALTENNEKYIKTYYKTLALANAEMDAKKSSKRVNKTILNQNMQSEYNQIYNNQYNNVFSQIGIRDGFEAIEHQTSSYPLDDSAKKSYHEGYLIGAKKRAEYNAFDIYYTLDKLEYKDIYKNSEAQNAHSQGLEDVLYRDTFETFVNRTGSLNKERWEKFFNSDNKGDEDLIKFKKRVNERRLYGFVAACEEIGYRYAMLGKLPKFTFEECEKSLPIKSEEFKNRCKDAYDKGVQRGLAIMNQNAQQ